MIIRFVGVGIDGRETVAETITDTHPGLHGDGEVWISIDAEGGRGNSLDEALRYLRVHTEDHERYRIETVDDSGEVEIIVPEAWHGQHQIERHLQMTYTDDLANASMHELDVRHECGMPDVLSGKWFHSFQDGAVNWQGQVLGRVGADRYMIRLYEWLAGTPTTQHIVTIDEMSEWTFYPTSEEMNFKDYARSHKDQQR